MLYRNLPTNFILLYIVMLTCKIWHFFFQMQLINVYLYDMVIGLNDPTKLILPAVFQVFTIVATTHVHTCLLILIYNNTSFTCCAQNIVMKSDERFPHMINQTTLNYCHKVFEAFIPCGDLNKIEQVWAMSVLSNFSYVFNDMCVIK